MNIAIFSTKPFDKEYLNKHNTDHHVLNFFEDRLEPRSASLAKGMEVVCPFVNDCVSADVLKILKAGGTRLIALRSAGYNHVDIKAAHDLGIAVAYVPDYSPYAVAEHTVGLILALNRKIHRAINRVRESDFSLHGLLGFDIHGKTVGVIGTGHIGRVFCRIMLGFGTRVLAYDPVQDPEVSALGVEYTDLDTLFKESHIISLHCPLDQSDFHMIDAKAIVKMRKGVMLINTSRGKLVDTHAVIEALKTEQIGALGLDVYEEEGCLFFENHSDQILLDDMIARLLSFNNVIITGHQAFFTQEALDNIAETTLKNVTAFEKGEGEICLVES